MVLSYLDIYLSANNFTWRFTSNEFYESCFVDFAGKFSSIQYAIIIIIIGSVAAVAVELGGCEVGEYAININTWLGVCWSHAVIEHWMRL